MLTVSALLPCKDVVSQFGHKIMEVGSPRTQRKHKTSHFAQGTHLHKSASDLLYDLN